MNNEVVRDLPKEEQIKMPVENAEVNILYTTAFSIYLIAKDAESRLKANNMSLGFRRKQLFNGILSDLKGAQHKQDELYQDYIKAWGSNLSNYDEELENANKLSKLLLLWFDRIEGFENRENDILEYIMKRYPEESISEEALKRFEVKK